MSIRRKQDTNPPWESPRMDKKNAWKKSLPVFRLSFSELLVKNLSLKKMSRLHEIIQLSIHTMRVLNVEKPVDLTTRFFHSPGFLEQVENTSAFVSELSHAVRIVIEQWIFTGDHADLVGSNYESSDTINVPPLQNVNVNEQDVSNGVEETKENEPPLILTEDESETDYAIDGDESESDGDEPDIPNPINLLDLFNDVPFTRADVQMAPVFLGVADLFTTCVICNEENKTMYRFCECTNGILCWSCVTNLPVLRERDGVDFKECPFCRMHHSPRPFCSPSHYVGPFENFSKTDKAKFFMQNTNWILEDAGALVDVESGKTIEQKKPACMAYRLHFIHKKIGFIDKFFTQPPIGTESFGTVKGRTIPSPYLNFTSIFDETSKFFRAHDVPFCSTPTFIFWASNIDVYQHVTRNEDFLTIEEFYVKFKKTCRTIRREIRMLEKRYLSFDEYLKRNCGAICPWTTSWAYYFNKYNAYFDFHWKTPVPKVCECESDIVEMERVNCKRPRLA